jgi:hypothetical protein
MREFLAAWKTVSALVDMVNEPQPPGFKLALFIDFCLAYTKHKSKTQ